MKLKKNPKPGQCAAMRCTATEGLVIVGDVPLCPTHQALHDNSAASSATDPDALSVELREYVQEAQEALTVLRANEIRTQAQLEEAGEWLKVAKERRQHFEAQEKAITGPINEALKKVRELFKPAKTVWTEVETILREKIAAVKAQEEARNAAALQAAAQAAARADTVATRTALAQVTTVGALPGIGTRGRWTAEVVDPGVLPREYLVPNLVKLREYCAQYSSDQEPAPIPGVVFKKVMGVVVR